MGYYTEYLDQQLGFPELTQKRKEQLARISHLRGGRDILVFACDLNKGNAPITIQYSDLLPLHDQLSNLQGAALDLILETPGGSGEIAEDIVRIIRNKYPEVAVIIPGCAKSAGTIIAMSADEILMEPSLSSLGPIDAQMTWQNKVFSAHALLEGMEKIKREVEKSGTLNKAYIPILQAISPGELEHAQNALNFAKVLVTEWLVKYKFKDWHTHSSTQQPVTDEEKQARAREIATQLCDHGRWKTHGKSIKLADLEEMRLLIKDYSKDAGLCEAIQRYYTLLQMSFATDIYKIIETPQSQIYRFAAPKGAVQQQQSDADVAVVELRCPSCDAISRVQANLGKPSPLQPNCVEFPANNRFSCPNCGRESDVADIRRQIEAQSKKPIVT